MDYKSSTIEELEAMKGKEICIFADHRISSKCRLVVNGMGFKVLGVSGNHFCLEPLPKEFKQKLIEIPISQNGILWEVADI